MGRLRNVESQWFACTDHDLTSIFNFSLVFSFANTCLIDSLLSFARLKHESLCFLLLSFSFPCFEFENILQVCIILGSYDTQHKRVDVCMYNTVHLSA